MLKLLKRFVAAVVCALSLAVAAPAEAHYFTHWQWRATGCHPAVQWAYGDWQEDINWTTDRFHNHAWYNTLTGSTFRTEGFMQMEWAIRGWECFGYPWGNKQQWLDNGRLVQRQTFSGRNIQLVYSGPTVNSTPYTVQIF